MHRSPPSPPTTNVDEIEVIFFFPAIFTTLYWGKGVIYRVVPIIFAPDCRSKNMYCSAYEGKTETAEFKTSLYLTVYELHTPFQKYTFPESIRQQTRRRGSIAKVLIYAKLHIKFKVSNYA